QPHSANHTGWPDAQKYSSGRPARPALPSTSPSRLLPLRWVVQIRYEVRASGPFIACSLLIIGGATQGQILDASRAAAKPRRGTRVMWRATWGCRVSLAVGIAHCAGK